MTVKSDNINEVTMFNNLQPEVYHRLESAVLEIFSKDDDFYLREIPFKIVSDNYVENHIPYSSLPLKQISGEFAELTEYQKSQLDYFLQSFTAAEA